MGLTGSWRLLATLAAAAVLGMLPVASAQVEPGTSLKDTLNPVRLEGGVSYAVVDGYEVYFIRDARVSGTSCIVLRNPTAQRVNKAETKSYANNFRNALGLRHYKILVTKDGRTALIMNRVVERRQLPRMAGYEALTHPHLSSALTWLTAAFDGSPERMEGSRLIWRKATSHPAPGGRRGRMQQGTLEVSLNLLRGAPCYVDIHMERVAEDWASWVLREALNIDMAPPRRNKQAHLARQLGAKPWLYFEDRMTIDDKRRLVSFCLVESEEDGYRLAATDTLRKLHEQGGEGAEPTPPQVEPLSLDGSHAAPKQPAAPPQKTAVPENAPEEQPAEAEETAPRAEEAAPVAVPATAPAMLTPEEARDAYAERLKVL